MHFIFTFYRMATRFFTCDNCSTLFEKEVKFYNRNIKRGSPNRCKTCRQRKIIKLHCEQCNIEFTKKPYEVRRTSHHYCSKPCFAYWHNAHKNKGTRRSKIEHFLEKRINDSYPKLALLCNKRDVIASELDLYFPDLSLAIELNGIVHYEPIYGLQTLSRIQRKDHEKRLACFSRNIELIIIPVKGKFSNEKAEAVFQLISDLLNLRISPA